MLSGKDQRPSSAGALYVLVDIPARRVEVFGRTPEQDWLFHEYLPGCGDCIFPALHFSVPFDAVFENVNPPWRRSPRIQYEEGECPRKKPSWAVPWALT